jgi:hypothetical protein
MKHKNRRVELGDINDPKRAGGISNAYLPKLFMGFQSSGS